MRLAVHHRCCLSRLPSHTDGLVRNLKTGFALLFLLAAMFGLSARLTMADAELRMASATLVQAGAPATQSAPREEHGLSEKAAEIARLFEFPITNSMFVSWIVALGLILFTQWATRNMRLVPTGA